MAAISPCKGGTLPDHTAAHLPETMLTSVLPRAIARIPSATSDRSWSCLTMTATSNAPQWAMRITPSAMRTSMPFSSTARNV